MELTVDDLLRIKRSRPLNLELLNGPELTGVSTDSRSVKRGDVFFALKGDRFDGHGFLKDAIEGGAAVCVVENAGALSGSNPVLVVRDTTKALGELANIYRSKFRIPVLAIGGSNGKTTTKEMVAAVLGSAFRVLRTEKNYNNHIGVPLTLFGLTKEHQAAVVEIGTNHPGEIMTLCRILDPTHGLVTNVGREHLEFFRTVRRVAAEEGTLYSYLRRSGRGTALINADDPWVLSGARGIPKAWKYGFSGPNLKVKGEVISIDSLGRVRFRFTRRGVKRGTTISMSVPGMHNAMNALAAAATGLALGVPPAKIQKSLAGFGAVKERMQVTTAGGVVILNDTYNANPDSVLAALRTLASMKSSGKKVVVLGDMKELGRASELEHKNIGQEVGKCGFEYLLTFGEQAKHINKSAGMDSKFHYGEKNTLAEYLFELVAPGDVVLVKGSRGMRMEDVVTFLQERLNSRNGVVMPREQRET